jgi:hypothetical protein
MITSTKLDSVMGTPWDRLMLACELIAEEASEQTKAFKVTPEMERGTAEEVFSRKHFEKLTNKKVTQIGFCISDEFPYLGVSGDGWIESNGKFTEAFETKSPDTKNAVFYKLEDLMSAEELGLGSYSESTKANPTPVFKPSAKAPFLGLPSQYQWQAVNYFLVNTDLQKLHFSIYDARFLDEKSRMHIVVVERNHPLMQEALSEARTELISFREFWMKCRTKIINDSF